MRLFQLVISVCLLPLLTPAQSKQFEIFGTITGNYKSKIYLFYDFNIAHKDSISAEIKNGKFYFKEVASLPVLAKFFLGGSSSTVQSVYIDNDKTFITCVSRFRFFQNVNNKADTSNDIVLTKVEGSATDNLRSSFEKWNKKLNTSGKTIQEKRDEYYHRIYSLIKKYPKSKVGPYLLGTASNLSYSQLNELRQLVDTSLNKSFEMVRVFHLLDIKERLIKAAEGSVFQYTVFKDLNNKEVDLRKTRNKYNLVVCWSSACVSCRQKNEELNAVYKKNKDVGFAIIGLCFDNDKQAWKDAVRKDKLNWIQLIEPNGVDGRLAKLYGIEMVPENFLLDGQGKLIAWGLTAKELEIRLKSNTMIGRK